MNQPTPSTHRHTTKMLACEHCDQPVAVDQTATRCLCWRCAPKVRLTRVLQDEFSLASSEPAAA